MSVKTPHHVHNLYRVRLDYKIVGDETTSRTRQWDFGHRLSDWAREIFHRPDAPGRRKKDDEESKGAQGEPLRIPVVPECDNKYCKRKWTQLEKDWEKACKDAGVKVPPEDWIDPEKLRVYCYVCNCKGCWDDKLKNEYTGACRSRQADRSHPRTQSTSSTTGVSWTRLASPSFPLEPSPSPASR